MWLTGCSRALGLRSDEPRDDEYPAAGDCHGSAHGDASACADGHGDASACADGHGDADDASQLPAWLHAWQHGAGAGSKRTAIAGAGPGGHWSRYAVPGPGPGGDAWTISMVTQRLQPNVVVSE